MPDDDDILWGGAARAFIDALFALRQQFYRAEHLCARTRLKRRVKPRTPSNASIEFTYFRHAIIDSFGAALIALASAAD